MPAWKILHTFFALILLILQSWQGLNNLFLELDALYRVIVYQIFKKLEGEIKQLIFWEVFVCFVHISQHIFISVYIELLWKIYYYRLCQRFIILSLLFVNWFTIPSDKNAHALVSSLSGMDVTWKISESIFAFTIFLSLNSRAVAWDTARLVIATSES